MNLVLLHSRSLCSTVQVRSMKLSFYKWINLARSLQDSFIYRMFWKAILEKR